MTKQDVSAGSSTAENQGPPPPAEGQKPSGSVDDRTVEQVMEESKRKTAENKALRDQIAQITEEKEDRIAELTEKARLNSNEKAELETLEEQVSALRADKRTGAWRELNKRDSEGVAKNVVGEHAQEMVVGYIEDIAEAEGIETDEMEKKIVRFMKRVDPSAVMGVYARARLAYKEYKREKALDAREQKLKDQEKTFSDSSSRSAADIPKVGEVAKEFFKDGTFKDSSHMTRVLADIANAQKVKRS